MSGHATSRPAVEAATALADKGGHVVTVNGRTARTPGRRPLVLPSSALAVAIADEITADPRRLAGEGLRDPAAAPLFRIACGAIDVIEGEADGRDRVAGEVAAYAATDLVCYRAAAPAALVRRQQAAWSPLLDWLADRYGARLAVTTGIRPLAQDPAALAKVAAAVEGRDAMALAALALATRAAGSVVIGLALAEGEIGAGTAFRAATLDEAFQAETWGTDAEASRARDGLRLDLEHAARFLAILGETEAG